MAKNLRQQGLEPDELAAEAAEALPYRERMSLLDLNIDLGLNADIAAPIDAAIAANANVAVPIDASVGANVGSVDSVVMPSAEQHAGITQVLTGVAEANATQTSTIDQDPGSHP